MATATVTSSILVNVSVYDICCSKIVIPWTINDVDDDEMSLNGFYELIIEDVDVNGHECVHCAGDAWGSLV